MFKVGQKVVCIDASIRSNKLPTGNLKEGEIYTIVSINHNGGLELKEISPPYTIYWDPTRFRPLDESFAETLLKEIAEEIEQEELILI